MSLLGQVLVLVLSFPVAGLLLYVLTVVERWVATGPGRTAPRERARHAEDHSPAGHQVLVTWPAHRRRQHAASTRRAG